MDKEKWEYNFPAYKDIPKHEDEELLQIAHIHQEANEVFTEWSEQYSSRDVNYDKLVMEILDVIHACETLLRVFTDETVDDCKKKVINKNAERGYYDDLRA